MNRILLALLTIGFAFSAQSQIILLEQDFQGFADGGDIPFVEEPDDAEAEDWLSIDSDNLADANTRPQNWYGTVGVEYILVDPIPEDTNWVMGSSSWLDGFAPGNRNYLITPELEIPEEGFVLRFDAGVRQTPRYADGMKVLVSPEAEMDDLPVNFSDTLWTQAQMVEDVSWVTEFYPGEDYTGCSAGGGFDVESFCWFPSTFGDGTDGTGYRHAEDHTVVEYLDESDNVWVGLNEPHTLDLSAYAGSTIRIAWLHDSDDDNFITVDNVVVEQPSSVAEFNFDELVQFYPNPATDRINLNFTTLVKNNAIVNIYDVNGKEVLSEVFSGNNLNAFHVLNIADLNAGVYSMQVTVDNTAVVGSSFMKY